MTHADLITLLERMRDVIWTEGEYKLSLHDVNATIDALKSGEVVCDWKDTARLDYLESERLDVPDMLFRRNCPITRAAIDRAMLEAREK